MGTSVPDLGDLLHEWLRAEVCDELDGALDSIPDLLKRPSYNFRHGLCPVLRDIDKSHTGGRFTRCSMARGGFLGYRLHRQSNRSADPSSMWHTVSAYPTRRGG